MGCTFLVIRNRLRFIATIESSLKQSERSKFVCWQHTTRRSYLSFHRFLTTPDQPAISLKTLWFLTSPIPSTDHRQLSGLFPSSSLRLLWRLQKYIFIFIILYAISVRENTQWWENWESIAKCNSLATSSSTWQIEDYFFNEIFYLETLNPEKTQWKHLLYIPNRFLLTNLLCEQTYLFFSGAVFLTSLHSPNGRVIENLHSPDTFDTRLGERANANVRHWRVSYEWFQPHAPRVPPYCTQPSTLLNMAVSGDIRNSSTLAGTENRKLSKMLCHFV